MSYFNFKRLIQKYSTEFTITFPTKGYFKPNGDYVEGEPKTETLSGAIISHRENKIFKANGTLTEKDRALYMLEPLPADLQTAEVKHEGNLYSIGSKLENAAFTGVYAYTLKFNSVFGGGAE